MLLEQITKITQTLALYDTKVSVNRPSLLILLTNIVLVYKFQQNESGFNVRQPLLKEGSFE